MSVLNKNDAVHKYLISALFENEAVGFSQSECRITVQNQKSKSRSDRIPVTTSVTHYVFLINSLVLICIQGKTRIAQ